MVLTTSATSGPAGSHSSASRGEPSRPVTAGSSCSPGVGKALASSWRSASRPRPVVEQTGYHREEVAAGDRLFQIVDQSLGGDLLASEITVHQGLVFALGDDPLDQLGPGLLDGGQVLGVGFAGLRWLALGVVEARAGRSGRAARPPTYRHRRASAGRGASRCRRTCAGTAPRSRRSRPDDDRAGPPRPRGACRPRRTPPTARPSRRRCRQPPTPRTGRRRPPAARHEARRRSRRNRGCPAG